MNFFEIVCVGFKLSAKLDKYASRTSLVDPNSLLLLPLTQSASGTENKFDPIEAQRRPKHVVDDLWF